MKKKILPIVLSLALLLSTFSMAFADDAVSEKVSFADMPDNWSTSALNKAVANGLLMGYEMDGENLIKADNPLTRAEMAAVVNRAFASTKTADIKKASDVAASAWYAKDMAKAVKMGTFALDTKMRPGDKITRQEAFAVLSRAFKLASNDSTHSGLDSFSDKGQIANWALKDLDGMAAAGYIQGSNGKLNPTANITRAEFAVVMDNLVKQYIDKAEEVTEVATDGNVMVRAAGVTLKNVTVKGDLIIADGVGDGDVTLDNVTVQGSTVVRGGGVNSIIVKGGSDIGRIIVAKVDGKVRISVEGGADVDVIVVADGSDDLIVEGSVGTLDVVGDGITVTLGEGAKVKDADISGKDSKIVANEGASVDKVTVSGSGATVDGKGTVRNVEVLEGGNDASINTPNTVTKVAEGVSGAKAGGTAVPSGSTATNNATGNGATVSDTSEGSSGGGDKTSQVSAVSVEGDARVGETLMAKVSPSGASSVTYQWQANTGDEDAFEDIDGATSRTFVIPESLNGKLIQVTAKGVRSSEATSEPVGPVVIPMEIAAELPEFVVGTSATFTIGTVPKGDNETMVRAHFTLPEGVTVEYQEGEVGDWIPLVDVFGPSSGFPLGSITTTFQGTFETAGTYTVKVEFKAVETEKVLASKDITVVVITQEQADALAAINDYLNGITVYSDVTKAKVDELADDVEKLGLYSEAYQALDPEEGTERHTAVFRDLWASADGAYDLTTLEEYFNSSVAVRIATEQSFNLVNSADVLNDIEYITIMLEAFEAAEHTHHGAKDRPMSAEITKLENLVTRYEKLDVDRQADVLEAVLTARGDKFVRASLSVTALQNALDAVDDAAQEAIDNALDAVNNATSDKAAMLAALIEHATVLELAMGEDSDYDALFDHPAGWSTDNRQQSVAHYVIDKCGAIHDGTYLTVQEITAAFNEGVAYELGKLEFHAAVKKGNFNKEAIEAARSVYYTMGKNLGEITENGEEYTVDDGDLNELLGMLDAYLALEGKYQLRIDQYVLTNVTGNDRLKRDAVFVTMAHAFDDETMPSITSIEVNMEDEDLILIVQVEDETGLFSLEIDHSHGKHGKWNIGLPEFHLYASEDNPYGSSETDFSSAGVEATYTADTKTWTLTLKPGENTALSAINSSSSNGAVEFYLVAKDIAGNSSGDMNGNYAKVTYDPNNGDD